LVTVGIEPLYQRIIKKEIMKMQKFKNNNTFFSVYFNCLPKRVAEGCIYFLAGNVFIAQDVETGRA